MNHIPLRAQSGQGGQHGFGSFTAFSDIGQPALKGSLDYDPASQVYELSGSGDNIWFAEDHFSFLWKEMEGDFILQAEMSFVGQGVNPHRKAGLMIRQDSDRGAAHASCVVHGDGLTSLQYRRSKDADMEELSFDIQGPAVLQLEKKGRSFSMSVAHRGELYTVRSLELPLDGTLMAGLFICSHDDTVIEKALFHNVRIFKTAPDTLVPYRDYLGSMLETLDVYSGQRKALASSPKCWEAPNWMPDNSALLFNTEGRIYRFPLRGAGMEEIPMDFATRNNNDHVISFKGDRLAISHHADEDDGSSVIYTLPIEGGKPQRVTPESPSYLHGWSPDDRFLVYTAQRNDAYNIYRIPSEGGKEEQLTFTPALDDGSEYSPDGEYIYFNSARTGTMQLWRMKPDGSELTQLTFDELNDWFPHVSPDGRWIVFLSYGPEVDAQDHPYYKQVYLRMMSTEELKPRVIGYLYGGQGTINVPSWSPDSRRIAFVSHGN